MIFLGVFTGAEGFMLGTMAARFEAEAILYAVAITGGVTLALTIFAFQTKIDFTACGGIYKFPIFLAQFNSFSSFLLYMVSSFCCCCCHNMY